MPDSQRGPHRARQKKWYDSARWKKAVASYKATHPLCAMCEQEGRLTPTATIDHIVPPKGDYRMFWDASNWQPSCLSCNARKARREQRGLA